MPDLTTAWLSFTLLTLLSVGVFAAYVMQWFAYRSLRKKYVEVASDYLQLAVALQSAKVTVVRQSASEAPTTVIPRTDFN